MPAKGQVIPPEKRFWRHVEKAGANDCWLWTGSINHKGYGMFRWAPGLNLVSAHRASWRIANHKTPGKMHVLHSCHNRACVNPKHLRLGTNLENMQDRSKAGNTPKGESSGRSTLSRRNVEKIREMYKTGEYTQKILSEMFGTSRHNIGYIVRGDSWKHLLEV